MAPLDITPMTKAEKLQSLEELAQKVLWLSTWTIHHANFVREKHDGLKVGGHQASCASSVAILTALYMSALRPEDRVAVKPHASPVFHAIQYLFGHQTQENLENFRAFGGAQSYPSRTKDADDVDISTGSVGMGPYSCRWSKTIYAATAIPSQRAIPAAWWRSSVMRKWTKATCTKLFGRVGSTAFAIAGGSSTTTDKAWMASCPIRCSA